MKSMVEPEKDGDPFEVPDADTMLRHLDPNAKPPHDVDGHYIGGSEELERFIARS